MKFFLILPLSILAFLFSCENNGEKPFEIHSDSFVLGYYELESLRIYEGENQCIKIFENTSGDIITGENKKSTEFNALNSAHNDVTYNRKVLYYNLPNIYLTPDFSAIRIISDADYNDEHPAGTSLSDITRFLSVSPFEYIESGYINTFNWKAYSKYEEFVGYWTFLSSSNNYYHNTLGAENVYPIDSKVTELTYSDLSILGRGVHITNGQLPYGPPLAVIKFIQEPTLSKDHYITISFVDRLGKEYHSNSLKISF